MYKPGGCGSLTILRELTSCSCIESLVLDSPLKHALIWYREIQWNWTMNQITRFSSQCCIKTGFSSQYLYCLIKWLLQGFPHSISTVLSRGYYRVFLTVFVLSYQVGFPHSIYTVLSSGYYRVFLTVFVLSYQDIKWFSSQYLYCLIKWLLQGFPQYLYCLIKWLLQGFPCSIKRFLS